MPVHPLPMRRRLICAGLLTPCLPAPAGPLLDRLRAARQPSPEDSLDEPEGAAAFTPPPGVGVIRDLAYGAEPKQRIDVYRPSQSTNGPVLLMVHGGGWRNGDKAMRSVVENKVARWLPRGITLASVDNRLLPEAGPLDQARDVARAIAFVQSRAADWGADPRQLVSMGHSAGAHLVALLGADPGLAASAGAAPWLGTVALDSAALDVPRIMASRHFRLYDQAFGDAPAAWAAASPFQALTASALPMLAVCSSRRRNSCEQAAAFASRAHSKGVRVEVLEEDLSHREINVTLGLESEYTRAVERFLSSLGEGFRTRLALR